LASRQLGLARLAVGDLGGHRVVCALRFVVLLGSDLKLNVELVDLRLDLGGLGALLLDRRAERRCGEARQKNRDEQRTKGPQKGALQASRLLCATPGGRMVWL
jgi:hypothetical protein